MRRFAVSLLVGVVLVGASTPCPATTTQEVWSQYVVAKKRLQMDTFELLSRKWSDLEHTLLRQRDQQLTLIAMRDLKFRWLAQNDPDRLVADQGLSVLSNFNWTDDDSKALRTESQDFRTLEAFLEHTNNALEKDARLAEARRRMMSMYTEERYLKLTARYRSHMETLETRLEQAGKAPIR